VKKLLRFISSLAILSFLITSCRSPQESSASKDPNSLTPDEVAEGWQLLFNGKSLDGWKRYNHNSIGPLWTATDGVILCDGKGLTEGTADIGGSLITTRQFGNFDLSVDYKISPGGNSGILYHVVEKPEFRFDYETGPEFQLMDDTGWKGGKLKEEQKAGGSYDMFAAPSTKKVNPAGEWNTARIVYANGHVEHWLNGEKIIAYEEDSDDFTTRLNKSKWKDYPAWNKSKTGAISLQDHGAPVYFRNIKIKEL
jgi:hypothetical protein